MTPEQIELLEKALALYNFSIEQRRESNYDVEEINEFSDMVEELRKVIQCELNYKKYF